MESETILKKAWALQHRIEERIRKDKLKSKDKKWNFLPWTWDESRWFELIKVLVWSWFAVHHLVPDRNWPIDVWIFWGNYLIISILVVFCFSFHDLDLMFKNDCERNN